MKPWERSWGQEQASAPAAKPWEREWGGGQAVEGEVPDFNTARRAGERSGDLLGSLFGAGDIVADKLEEALPAGGFAWQNGDILPSYMGPKEYAQFMQESGSREPLETARDYWKDTDLGYVPNHTAGRLKETYQREGLFDLDTLKEGGQFAFEQGVGSIPDMLAAVYAPPAYVAARAEEMGQERAANKGMDEAGMQELVEALPGSIANMMLERFGAKGVGNAGKNVGEDVIRGVVRTTAKEAGKAALKEGGTEFAQEGGIEYLTEKAGTGADMSLAEALERGMFGAIGGGGFGAMAGGTMAAPRTMMQNAEVRQRQRMEAEQRNAQPAPTPEPETMALPDPRNMSHAPIPVADPPLDGPGMDQQTARGEPPAAPTPDQRTAPRRQADRVSGSPGRRGMSPGEAQLIAAMRQLSLPSPQNMGQAPIQIDPARTTGPGLEQQAPRPATPMQMGDGLEQQTERRIDPSRAEEGDRRAFDVLRDDINAIEDPNERAAAIDELRRVATIDMRTGMGNNNAMRLHIKSLEDSGKPYQTISMDVSGLKWVNDNMNAKVGDELIAVTGQAIQQAAEEQGITAFSPKGDEFYAFHEDQNVLENIYQRAQDILKDAKFTYTLPDGTVIEKTGAEIYKGFGPTPEDADAKLNADKDATKAANKQKLREQGITDDRLAEPPGVVRKPAAGRGVEGDTAPEVERGQAVGAESRNDFVGSLREEWERYDSTGESTHEDLVNAAEYLIDDTDYQGPEVGLISDAIAAYRKEQADDVELGGRNDMDQAEDAFNEAIESVFSSKQEQGQVADSEFAEAYRQMQDAMRGGGKLSANPFLDPEFLKPMAKMVKAAFGMSAKKLDQWMGGVSESLKEYRGVEGDMAHRTIGQQAGWIGRMFVQSNDGIFRALASKYNSPTIEKIADMFWAKTGEGGSTAQTYHEAVEGRIMTRLTKLDKALSPFLKDKSSLQQITNLLRNPDNIKKGTPLHDAADSIRTMLKEELEYMRESGLEVGEVMDGYFPRMYDITSILGSTSKFINKAARAYRKTYPDLTQEQALEMAEKWRDNMLLADAGVKTEGSDFATIAGGAPAPNNTKPRVFGKEAEAELAEFMINSPVDALTSYFMRSARRAEWERRLGQGQWQQMKQQMIDEGAYGAIDDVVKTIQSSAGFMPSALNPSTNNVFSLARMANALTFLSHATLSSVSEIVLPAVRTGDARTILRSVYISGKSLFKTESRAEIEEITTDLLGVTGKIAIDTLMQQRVGGTFDSKKMQHITNRFFTATGLHHFTEATRIAAADLGMSFIQRLAKEVSTGHRRQKSSTLLLQEMGVPADKMGAFTKFVAEHDTMTKEALEGNAEMQEVYKLALTRFIDQSIMRPNASEKPRYANHPVGSLFYALQSFLYSFAKNVSIRNLKLLKEATATGKDYTLSDRAALAMPMAMMLLPIMIQMALVDARDDLFDDGTDDDRERSNGDKAMTAISRSGLLGAFDVYANLFTGLRYDKDPATTALGPELGMISEAFDSLVTVMDPQKNSENTNTAERNAAKKVYDVLVKPTLNYGASILPYRLGAPLIQASSHPATREQFMQLIAGEKGEKADDSGGDTLRGESMRGESMRGGSMRE